jgi:hypothetical protein
MDNRLNAGLQTMLASDIGPVFGIDLTRLDDPAA